LRAAAAPARCGYSDEKVANRDRRGFGWEIAAVSRRPPIPLYEVVPGAEGHNTPREFGRCPSFKDHFLSPTCV
jgi:hypothetical protein